MEKVKNFFSFLGGGGGRGDGGVVGGGGGMLLIHLLQMSSLRHDMSCVNCLIHSDAQLVGIKVRESDTT